MFCENCGAQIESGHQFCSRCGTPVPSAGPEATGAHGTTPIPTSQPQRRTSSVGVPLLAALCGILAMVLIGFGLAAGGVLSIGGNQAAPAPQASTSPEALSTTAEESGKLKKAQEEAEKAKQEAEQAKKEAEQAKKEAEEKSAESDPAITNNITVNSVPGATRVTTSAPPSRVSSSAYVLPDSATHYYSTDELSGLSNWDLYIARNEIYARHGRGFVRDDLRDYFSGCSWYVERYEPDYFDDVIAPNMSDCEWHNIQTILDYEHYRGSPYP